MADSLFQLHLVDLEMAGISMRTGSEAKGLINPQPMFRAPSIKTWFQGAMSASIFPLPDTVRAGNLPKDYFRRPGYTRVDAALVKGFPIPIGRAKEPICKCGLRPSTFLTTLT